MSAANRIAAKEFAASLLCSARKTLRMYAELVERYDTFDEFFESYPHADRITNDAFAAMAWVVSGGPTEWATMSYQDAHETLFPESMGDYRLWRGLILDRLLHLDNPQVASGLRWAKSQEGSERLFVGIHDEARKQDEYYASRKTAAA